MQIRRLDGAVAARQAAWIVTMDPWRSLGYRQDRLGRYLRKMGAAKQVLAVERKGRVAGLLVFQRDVLLGDFIALVAVRPECAGQGIGRALVVRVEELTFRKRRWLYVSSDSRNRQAGRFYRKLGFRRVAVLADLVSPGRTELLWRKPRARD